MTSRKRRQWEGSKRGGAFVERLHVNGRKHGHNGAHHERQGEHHVACHNEQRGAAEVSNVAVGQQQRKCNGKARNSERERDDFFDRAGHSSAPHMQCVGCGYADGRMTTMRDRFLFAGQLVFTLTVAAFLIVPAIQSMLAGVTSNYFRGVRSGLTVQWLMQVFDLYSDTIVLSFFIAFATLAITLIAATVLPLTERASARTADATSPRPTDPRRTSVWVRSAGSAAGP
jgi:hypothetical protein